MTFWGRKPGFPGALWGMGAPGCGPGAAALRGGTAPGPGMGPGADRGFSSKGRTASWTAWAASASAALACFQGLLASLNTVVSWPTATALPQ